MKYLITVLLVFFSVNTIQSQVFDPVKWSSKAVKVSEDVYEITYTATIDKHWHFYSQVATEEDGPIATEFTFINPNNAFERIGETSESETIDVFEQVFQMDVSYFEDEAVFTQKFKILDPEITHIKAEVFYQACDEVRCLMPTTYEFNTPLSGEEETVQVATIDHKDKILADKLSIAVTGWDNYEQEEVKNKSHLSIFILGFLGGLLALLTPCVFPMIPLTVSFFTKSASNSQKGLANAMLYG